MSAVFISYKREDIRLARQLRGALGREGWSVWWDPELRGGERFDDVIGAALREAKVIVVLWSRRSVASEYVKDEAAFALKHDKLLPVAIEEVDLPFRFETRHTLWLIDWDGSQASPQFQAIADQVRSMAGEPPSPASDQEDWTGNDHVALTAKSLLQLREMADSYLEIEGGDWRTRVRQKDQCGQAMVDFMDTHGIAKQDIAHEDHEGFILALAWKIRVSPGQHDLYSLLSVSSKVESLHVRYRILLAIDRLLENEYVPEESFSLIEQILERFEEGADPPLLTRIDQTRYSLELSRGGT